LAEPQDSEEPRLNNIDPENLILKQKSLKFYFSFDLSSLSYKASLSDNDVDFD
jgi:hypothetical protein